MRAHVILPAFNEAQNLPPLIEALAETLSRCNIRYGIAVVDDGSRDQTRGAVDAYAGRLPVRVIGHEQNRGLAAALLTGLTTILPEAAGDDVIVVMDADNTHPADLLPRMLEEIRRGRDLVIASRYVRGSVQEGVPLVRRILSRIIGLLIHLRFGLWEVRDLNCGYRAYRASLLQAGVRLYGSRLIESKGFTVMAELLLKLARLRPAFAEVPLHLRYDRKGGASKLKLLRVSREYFGLLWRGASALEPPADRRRLAL